MSWTRRFLPTNFLSYPCFYTFINAKTEHIITVVSFEWSDITEFSNNHRKFSYVIQDKKKICYFWICRVLLLLLQSISRRGLDSFFGRFIRRYSGDVQKRSRFIFWTLHQKIFWRCTEESNQTCPSCFRSIT